MRDFKPNQTESEKKSKHFGLKMKIIGLIDLLLQQDSLLNYRTFVRYISKLPENLTIDAVFSESAPKLNMTKFDHDWR